MNSSKILLSTLVALPLLAFAPMGLCDADASKSAGPKTSDMEEMRAKMHEIHEEMQKLKANTADEMKKLRQEMQNLKAEAKEKMEKKHDDMKMKHEDHQKQKASKDAMKKDTTNNPSATTTSKE